MTTWKQKDPSENFLVDFDFSATLTSVSSATVTSELESGTDASPSAILVAARTISGTKVQQRVGVGQPGCRYRFKCVASDGTNTFTLYSSLPVAYTVQDQGRISIADYTGYAEVRAALGISDDEVDDATLELPMYGNHLAMEFDELADELSLTDDIDVTYAALKSVALNTLTKGQKRVLAAASLFATYAVARHLGTSLAMAAPKSLGDGKALMSRFSDSPYKQTLAQVEVQYEKAKTAIVKALDALNSTTSAAITTVFVGVASPATDPVVE